MAPESKQHRAGNSLGARSGTIGARLKHSLLFRTRRRTILTLLVGIPLVLCIGSWLLGLVVFADAATVTALKGVVQARHEENPQWEPAHVNQLLWHDYRMRTGSGSSARLVFFDVSTVDLDEETEVTIAQVSRRQGGNATRVVLKVWLGNMAVRAVRFVDPSSSF